MQFSDQSDITLVVTSCGRFDLLKRTLETFDLFNTADIREVFITEDSVDEAVRLAIPGHWRSHCSFLVNRPKLGQLASIDLAYESVNTPYIFHCEDDWAFYRSGFVEGSKVVLELRPDILQCLVAQLRVRLAGAQSLHPSGAARSDRRCALLPLAV